MRVTADHDRTDLTCGLRRKMMRGRITHAARTGVLGAIVLAVLGVWAVSGAVGSAAMASRPLGASGQPVVTSEVAAKLAALKAENPQGYLLLAEEIADSAATEADLRLARQLYTLALVLDGGENGAKATAAGGAGETDNAGKGQRQTASSVAASACYGLAELTRSPTERRWLMATASAARPQAIKDRIQPVRLVETTINLTPAVHLFDAISMARGGEGRRADAMLKRPGAGELLAKFERALDDRGYFNSASRIKRWITEWPTCTECANKRVVSRTEGGKTITRVCSTCRGNPGPPLGLDDLVNQVRFQSALLSGIQNSWSAALLVDGGEPAREPEPAAVARVYGVDVAATQWRDGQWVRPK